MFLISISCSIDLKPKKLIDVLKSFCIAFSHQILLLNSTSTETKDWSSFASILVIKTFSKLRTELSFAQAISLIFDLIDFKIFSLFSVVGVVLSVLFLAQSEGFWFLISGNVWLKSIPLLVLSS